LPGGAIVPRPYSSGVIPAPADQVWEIIRLFNDLPSWLPAIKSSELLGGAEGQVGVVRRLTVGDGGVLHEKLIALSDEDHQLTYTFVDDNPFGVRRYVSTVRVAPITDSGQAFVEWRAEFDAEGADEARLTDFFAREVFGAGIEALRQRFSGR
jgi:hypothetical protein